MSDFDRTMKGTLDNIMREVREVVSQHLQEYQPARPHWPIYTALRERAERAERERGRWKETADRRLHKLDDLGKRVRELELERDHHMCSEHVRPQVTDEAVEALAQHRHFEVVRAPWDFASDKEQELYRKKARKYLNIAFDAMTPRPGGGEPEPFGYVLSDAIRHVRKSGIFSGTIYEKPTEHHDTPIYLTPDAPAPSEESVEGTVRGYYDDERTSLVVDVTRPLDVRVGTPVTITRTNPLEETDADR